LLPARRDHAIVEALSPLGVSDIEMRVTPQRIWESIRAASQALQPNGIG
jgi:hypothetical protein